jgi:hypothetical protein
VVSNSTTSLQKWPRPFSDMDTSKDIAEGKDMSAEHAEFPTETSRPFQIPEVTWWKHAGLRKLYIMMPILFLGRG